MVVNFDSLLYLNPCPPGQWWQLRKGLFKAGEPMYACSPIEIGGPLNANHNDLDAGGPVVVTVPTPKREFDTGATRDTNRGKFEYARFFSPEVVESQAGYMHKHRKMLDGSSREPDNWKRGIPRRTYMDSLHRHEQDLWFMFENGLDARQRPDTGETVTLKDAIHGILFNASGLLYEMLKGRDVKETR